MITKVEHRKLDPAYEIYFALYQQLVGTDGEEIFREFSPSSSTSSSSTSAIAAVLPTIRHGARFSNTSAPPSKSA